MNDFINHLLTRHIETDNNVKPRIRGRFEPAQTSLKAHLGDDVYALDTMYGQSQIVPPQEQQGFVAEPAKQPADAFSKQSFENDPAMLDDMKTGILNPITPPSTLPAEQQIPDGSAHVNNEGKATIENHFFSNSHIENNTISSFAGNRPEAEKTTSTFSNLHATETVKPALKMYKTEGTERESRNDVFRGAFNQFKQSSDQSRTTQYETESNQPVIKVTIGRIDVRAIVQSTPSQVKQVTTATPKLSLEDYLKQRNKQTS